MKSVSLHGPWAFYERKCSEQDGRIQQLEGEVAYYRALATEAKEQLSAAEDKVQGLQNHTIPSLQNESQLHLELVSQLQAQLEEERRKTAERDEEAAAREHATTEQLQSLLADNVFLKGELVKHMQTRQLTSTKVEEARRKMMQNVLSLTPSEADCYIKVRPVVLHAVHVKAACMWAICMHARRTLAASTTCRTWMRLKLQTRRCARRWLH